MRHDPDWDPPDVASGFQTFEEFKTALDWFDIDTDFFSGVPVPIPHKPTLPDLAIAVPEPEDKEPS